MANGVNKVFLLGNLGADPEMRFSENGLAICTFRIATSESWTDKDGEKQERTEWHRITAFKRLGELCGEYLAKGRQVHVEGKIQTDSWEDEKSGEKKYATKIIARNVTFIGGGKDAKGNKDDGASTNPDNPPF